jgi:hypothetical protein
VGDTAFLSAYVDLKGPGGTPVTFQIPSSNLGFAGYWGNDPECVQVSYSSTTTPPENTDTNNICPDGNVGPCDTLAPCANQGNKKVERWECPSTPMDQSQPPSSSNYPMKPAGKCTSISQLDFNNW